MSLPTDVQGALDRAIDTKRLAGALALVWHEGETVVTASAGYRDIAHGLPMGTDTIFQIASMTKPIVSVAALQLVDEGRLRLGDPIARWLPEFAAPRVLDDPAGPLERTHPATRPITVADLLTHRSGLGYCFLESGPIAVALQPLVDNILRPTLTPDQWLATLAALPLVAEPGERFRYGHSTELLGCLVARLDGVTLGESLSRRVFEPLGMADTAFHVPAGKLRRLARLYGPTAAGFIDVTEPRVAPPLFEAGGGGLYSTAADYLRFARALVGKGEADGVRLLRQGTAERMARNQLTAPQRRLEALGQPDFFAHTGFGYGVAVEIEPAAPLFLAPGSLSWGGIWGTGWRADPANRLISLFFTQAAADTSSDAPRRAPGELTAPAALQLEIEQLVWDALLHNRAGDGWVRLAPRRRSPPA